MRGGAILATTLLAGLLLAPAAPASAEATAAELVTQADAVPTPTLDWTPCTEPGLGRYQCATVEVPLDYAKPQGTKQSLALLRQPATESARRIGTLFTAVGGPGASGIDAVRDNGFATELARRFDMVTFDQRGIGRSGQVRCFADSTAQQQFWADYAPPPTNARQEAEVEQASRVLAEGCATHSGELLPHLTTVDAARDLDLLRRAVGDEKLTYMGGSYASYLGQVYGTLFGDRVRALHLGSVIEPDAYTEDSLTHLAEQAMGTEQAFNEFARLCAEAGSARCAFAEGDVRARHVALFDRLRGEPLTIGSGERALTVTYTDVITAEVFLLYDAREGWPVLGTLLAELDRGTSGDPDVVRGIIDATPVSPEFLESFIAISCADNAFPNSPHLWPYLARAIEPAAATFGAYWLYPQQACGAWPAPPDGYPQRFTGPWTHRTETPALLLNTRFDPATPLSMAERAQRTIGNARLVTIDGYGHTTNNTCAHRLRDTYLIDLNLPEPATVCPADTAPFVK
ncbi:alpha/beta fold hydrolase [Nocardia uniformis]|uniref:Alpha/beta fold hydrolase n=1 Tax=Nocardia uniformis TaxID=53432 RepID=A0A849C1S2_9NOCA|nr:alpha/beta hydrolase [Nocardia uniformis]NNH70400.1 alpha/beta fold hydrolase [Nocardia uniformis]